MVEPLQARVKVAEDAWRKLRGLMGRRVTCPTPKFIVEMMDSICSPDPKPTEATGMKQQKPKAKIRRKWQLCDECNSEGIGLMREVGECYCEACGGVGGVWVEADAEKSKENT